MAPPPETVVVTATMVFEGSGTVLPPLMVKLLPTMVKVGTELIVYEGCEPLILILVLGVNVVAGTFKANVFVPAGVTVMPPPLPVTDVLGVTGIEIVFVEGPTCKVPLL